MTRDELIEALAESAHQWRSNGERSWAAAAENTKQNYRAVIAADFLPLIVASVGEWLDDQHEGARATSAWALRRRWEQEMTRDA